MKQPKKTSPTSPPASPTKPSPGAASSMPSPSHEEISELARRIWHERGQPDGRDLEHWLEAERQLGVRPSQSGSAELTVEEIESDKNVDGLVQRPR